jgi:hypothetical protein
MKTLGVLAIIFASLGLISALSPLALPHEHIMWSGLSPYAKWVTVWALLTAAISGLHLAAGIQTVRGQRSGPRLLAIYAIAAFVLIAADVALSFATWHGSMVGSHFDLQVAPRLALDVVSLPWPIVVLAVVHRRRSR